MSPYPMAIHILYFLAHVTPFVSNSYVPSTMNLSKRGQDSTVDSQSSGTLIVRQTNTQSGEFSTISAAVEALKDLKGPQKIFVNPGVYREQVHIKYKYPLKLQGYSQDPHSLSANRVTIEVAVSAAERNGENAKSSAIWVRSPDFQMSNMNVINSYGTGTDTQALALTAQGQNHVYKRCLFSSYQDTLGIKTKGSFFFGCRIEGAVDFIFGPGTAWFEMSDIVVKTPKHISTITAQKRASGDNSIFVFYKSKVIAMDENTPANVAYLGRPWSKYAAVMFQSCYLSQVVNPAGWVEWGPQDPRTDHVQFQEFGNYGPGAPTKDRHLGSIKSQPLNIEDVLGSDYKTWIDQDSS